MQATCTIDVFVQYAKLEDPIQDLLMLCGITDLSIQAMKADNVNTLYDLLRKPVGVPEKEERKILQYLSYRLAKKFGMTEMPSNRTVYYYHPNPCIATEPLDPIPNPLSFENVMLNTVCIVIGLCILSIFR